MYSHLYSYGFIWYETDIPTSSTLKTPVNYLAGVSVF
ncbi:hypothetical protein B0O79_2438 [Flavobacteriaceae bacterium MAR_2009_75]|nr:hypothetical protein B0O79_2438 [Flavobacteriaceae bacterium MAR_2009_75]